MRLGSPASLGSVTICSLEGNHDNDRLGLLQVLIPLRAIQSVDTSTSDYGAEFVRATGRHHPRDPELGHQTNFIARMSSTG